MCQGCNMILPVSMFYCTSYLAKLFGHTLIHLAVSNHQTGLLLDWTIARLDYSNHNNLATKINLQS